MKTIVERMQEMDKHQFVYRGEVVEVLGHVLHTGDDGNEYEILLSNGRTLTGPMERLEDKLTEFVSADNHIAVVVDQRMNQVSSFCGDTMSQLRDAVLETIRVVREDPSKVGQAKQVFQGVNTLINLAKTELEYRRYVDSLNKKK